MKLVRELHENWPLATEMQKLQARLWRICRTDDLKVILFTSALRGEGKSTTVAHVAAMLALHPDRKIVVVDMDLRRPQIHMHYETPVAPGLSDCILKKQGLDRCLRKTELPNLDLLVAGTRMPRAEDVLNSPEMRELIIELRRRYDLVLIDTPALVPVADASGFIQHSDGVVLVVMAGKSTRPHVARARELCLGMGARILGVVVGNIQEAAPEYYNVKHYRDYENVSDLKLEILPESQEDK